MRYKFSLKPQIRATVEWELSAYRESQRQLDIIKRDMIPSGVQGYSLTAGVDGGEAKRSTEEVTMRKLDKDELRLVDMIYWRKEFTPEGAGMIVGMSRATVYRRLNKIICAVAYEMGYIEEVV